MKNLLTYLSILLAMVFSSACTLNLVNSAGRNEANEILVDSDISKGLIAAIEVHEPIRQAGGGPIIVKFLLKNNSEDPLYLLKWYTPLEGIAGEIFDVIRDGQKVPYIGILAKRGDPTPESYVLLNPGEEITSEVNIAEAYDFSALGLYSITFRSPRISHIAHSEEEIPATLEELGPISIPSNTVTLEITDPAVSPLQPGFGPDMITADTPPESHQGRIDFPSKTGDAGNFVLQAGDVISFNWLDFPVGAGFYTIAIKPHNEGQLIKIGTDLDTSDGVMVDWEVPENISGSVVGFACFEDGNCIGAEWSGEVYSGTLPPDQICTVKLFNTGVVDVYLEPDKGSPKIAYLIPGVYAQVYGISAGQWLWIELTNLEFSAQEYSSISRGFVPLQGSLELFGPCDSLTEK